MDKTPEQKRLAEIAAMYGYKYNTASDWGCVPIDELAVGEGVIILRGDGEPQMSGVIDEINYPAVDEFGYRSSGSIKVGDNWYYDTNDKFRRL